MFANLIIIDVMMFSILNIYADLVFEANLQIYFHFQNRHFSNFQNFILSILSI